ncbi:MAG: hypothetical protein RMK19_06050 [Bacteroidia bacterium]|nr:hypothetical protein [Bacteroidia bacterium]MDW8015555.1 hypothetical protein [Bacteroidia bacterium]
MIPTAKRDIAREELKTIRDRLKFIGWLIFLAHGMTVGLAYLLDVPSEAKRFYLWVYGAAALLALIISFIISRFSTWPWRASIAVLGVFPFLIEMAYFSPFLGAGMWWVCVFAGYVSALLFTWREWPVGVSLTVGIGLLAALVGLFHSFTAQLPGCAVSHGYLRYALVQAGMIGGSVIAIILSRQLRKRIEEREEKLYESLEAQAALAAQLSAQKEEAEQRRLQAEKALAEVAQLREEERRRAETEAFFMRYETLMRTS